MRTFKIVIFILVVFGLFFRARHVERQLRDEEINMLTGINLYAAKAACEMYDNKMLVSVTMAMAILESGWGKSKASRRWKAFFGWKAPRDKKLQKTRFWDGKKGRNGDGECKAYDEITKSWFDHVDSLVRLPRYDECENIKHPDKRKRAHAVARCLQKSGYCPSKDYDEKLCDIIDKYELYKHDK